ncbi:hypothetical protein [Rhodococcus koreensis]|uniref:hypothetical protein n=1 Tax=Rhodococcus koreensis TaxID=99653 RepID=UPI0036709122
MCRTHWPRRGRVYIHLSGRDLADNLGRGMDHIHAWRIGMLTGMDAATAGTPQ